MCDPFGTGDAADKAAKQAKAAAERARREEELRQKKVESGRKRIDKSFGQYDDSYYSTFGDAYKGNYNPQVEDQYDTAFGKLMAGLARQGILQSTAGIGKFGELSKQRGENLTRIGNDAESAIGDLKNKVATNKSDLYALNEASADPKGIEAQATARATSLAAPPTYTPLGDLFGALVQPYLIYNQARQGAVGGGYGGNGNYGGYNSGKVVG